MMRCKARAAGVVCAIRRRWHPGARDEVERGHGWCHARRACQWLSSSPFPRPAPRVTSEALPYGILRRMSTAEHGTGPYGCGAVLGGGLVGSAWGARQCAAVTLRRLVAVVLALAGLTLIFLR